jgi:transposase-like protein
MDVSIPTATWDLAGLTDRSGSLGRPVAAGEILVPRDVRLDGDFVTWANPLRSGHYVKPSRAVLDRFLRLRDAPPEATLKFVREWGPLQLWAALARQVPDFDFARDGTRLVRIAERMFATRFADGLGFSGRGLSFGSSLLVAGRWGEPLSVYRAVAGFVGQLVDEVALIHSDQLLPKDWEARYPQPKYCGNASHGRDCAFFLVEHWVDRLLRLGGVSFAPEYSKTLRRWRIIVRFPGVLGAIAMQLLLLVTRSDALLVCCGCGQPYVRDGSSRRPKPGQSNYCGECGRTAAARAAKRRWRERVLTARHMHAEGREVAEIARALGVPSSRVARWLAGVRL